MEPRFDTEIAEDKVVQVIVIRRKFPDGKGGTRGINAGKQVAQGAHASVHFLAEKLVAGIQFNNAKDRLPQFIEWAQATGFVIGQSGIAIVLSAEEIEWMVTYQYAKVTLQVDGDDELLEVYKAAQSAGLNVHLITDSGLTEFNGVPTRTCLAIGPHRKSRINPVTGGLKLL